MKLSGIYSLKSRSTGEVLYVGKSSDLHARKLRHFSKMRTGNHIRNGLNIWYNDYGKDDIIFDILIYCPENELNSQEIYWFNELSPKFYGKMPSIKGEGNHTEYTKIKISNSLKEYNKENPSSVMVILMSNLSKIVYWAENPKITINNSAKAIGVSKKSFKNFLDLHNIQWVHGIGSQEDNIVKWYLEDKLSARAIAKLLGISQPSVVNRISKLKLKDQRFSHVVERKSFMGV